MTYVINAHLFPLYTVVRLVRSRAWGMKMLIDSNRAIIYFLYYSIINNIPLFPSFYTAPEGWRSAGEGSIQQRATTQDQEGSSRRAKEQIFDRMLRIFTCCVSRWSSRNIKSKAWKVMNKFSATSIVVLNETSKQGWLKAYSPWNRQHKRLLIRPLVDRIRG